MNWLLIFIPFAVIADHVQGTPAALRFASAAFAIVPLAKVMIDATEQIAHRTGATIGALLNATFGNAPELIISLIALQAGLIDMVREKWPEMPVHLSVQANTVNAAAVRFWQGVGVQRVILSRELSLDEIAEIRQVLLPERKIQAVRAVQILHDLGIERAFQVERAAGRETIAP